MDEATRQRTRGARSLPKPICMTDCRLTQKENAELAALVRSSCTASSQKTYATYHRHFEVVDLHATPLLHACSLSLNPPPAPSPPNLHLHLCSSC